jgi:HEAT repeat protein
MVRARSSWSLVLLLAAALLAPAGRGWSHARGAPAPAALQDDAGEQAVKDFKKYFRKYKDAPTRIEAVMALRLVDSPGVVEALVPVLAEEDPQVQQAALTVLAGLKAPESVAAVGAAFGAASGAQSRMLLLDVLARGKMAIDVALLEPALADGDWRVRWRAVAAVAARGEPDAAKVVPLAADAEAGVRMAVLDGLYKIRSELVVTPAIAALDDPVWQVRSSAIAALRYVRHKDAVGPLVERMQVEKGRLQAEIADALENLAYRDFGQDPALWQAWWEEVAERFELPKVDMRNRRAVTGAGGEEAVHDTGQKAATFGSIESPSRRILFVIDVSGSMESLVVEKEKFKDGGYPSFLRMDIVKTELMRTIEGLESYVEFNVLAFASDLRSWKKTLVPANDVNKASALSWAKSLEAIGGASKADLAAVGLLGAAEATAGKTNTYEALMWGLGVERSGVVTEGYQTEVDTIFFLSDGRPSHGKFVDTDDIVREVRAANELRKIVIHTIAIGEFEKDFMRRLAQENGGVFVDLGR